jgi:hypothetical protein
MKFRRIICIPSGRTLVARGIAGEDRKNIAGVMFIVFYIHLKIQKDQPALILKTSGATYSILDKHEIETKINSIKNMFPKDRLPNIYLVTWRFN